MANFSGIYTALVTPMHDDHSINLEVLEQIVEFQVSQGVTGLWLCGASAEALQMSEQERRPHGYENWKEYDLKIRFLHMELL